MAEENSKDVVEKGGAVKEIIYVSWGGTGRGVTLRHALAEVAELDAKLVYLAVLDDSSFSDVDLAMLELAREELAWLLEAQISLTKSQLSAEHLQVRILVRSGDVSDEIAEVVDTIGNTEVLIGAPVPLAARGTIADFIDHLKKRLEVPVRLIDASS